jgi:hypothetical protein
MNIEEKYELIPKYILKANYEPEDDLL